MHNYPNSACTQNTFCVHALARQLCMYTSGLRFSVSSIQTGGSGTASTKNIPHLHTLGPQFCMYVKHIWPTYIIVSILHVRKTRLAYTGVLDHLVRKTYHIYMHNYHNSACTQNTFFVHALARQFRMYAKHFFRTCTREAILHV